MNFVTNTGVMLDRILLHKRCTSPAWCRMPNQSLSDDEAREVHELQRKNNGKNWFEIYSV